MNHLFDRNSTTYIRLDYYIFKIYHLIFNSFHLLDTPKRNSTSLCDNKMQNVIGDSIRVCNYRMLIENRSLDRLIQKEWAILLLHLRNAKNPEIRFSLFTFLLLIVSFAEISCFLKIKCIVTDSSYIINSML